MLCRRAVFAVCLLAAGCAAGDSVVTPEPELAAFVTPADTPAVRRCRDALSYLCGNATGDGCVSPRAFCDGRTDCASGWDERDCAPALPD